MGGKHSRFVAPADKAAYVEKNPLVDPTVSVDGGIVTATVTEFDGFTGDHQKYADALATNLDQSLKAGACGVIVDLRGNGGGDMGPMLAGLTPILPDGTAVRFAGKNFTSDVAVNGGSVSGGGTPTTVSGIGKYSVPVALLTDSKTASSAEATLLSFKGVKDTRTFGTPTAGYASANMSFEMPDSALVLITTAWDEDREGNRYGDDPIVPDEATDDAPTAAKAWLESAHQCH